MSWAVRQGDCRELLRAMPAESVHCVVTSPPYWGLRDYGLPPLVWGGDEGCEHKWGEKTKRMLHTGSSASEKERSVRGAFHGNQSTHDQYCRHCHAWRGSLGLEPTPELYIEHMVEVFREVKRVMRKDATCWVNMGDSYANPSGSPKAEMSAASQRQGRTFTAVVPPKHGPGLKPKDLCGMPWRLAFALQADGWWLRSEIIWHKPNPMPESVRDRPTKAHETVFLLTKASRYFYDADAIREPISETASYGGKYTKQTKAFNQQGNIGKQGMVIEKPADAHRNKRTVWTIPTSPFPGSHFATFPPKLIEPMILTSPTKCCAVCGKGWERVTEVTQHKIGNSVLSMGGDANRASRHRDDHPQFRTRKETATLGFRPACGCHVRGRDDDPWLLGIEPPTVPATVLDPFSGASTTIMVALRHGRNAIGHELSEEYCKMGRQRVIDDNPMFNGGLT